MPGPLTGAVLAGGLATRLGAAASGSPKALLPVGGRPFLFRVLDQLAGAGVERLVLCTGHLGEKVRDAVGAAYAGIPVLYSHEESPLGTGGAIREAHRSFGGSLWLAANGDSYVHCDLAGLVRTQAGSHCPAAMLAVRVEDAARFGSLDLDEGQRITGFREKSGQPRPAWINGGVYCIAGALLGALPQQSPLSLERDVFPAWLPLGVQAWPSHGAFIDIGTPESLAAAEDFFQRLGR